MDEPDPDDARLLFCPFCRECYEGKARCPVHELPLVDFVDLPKMAHERRLPAYEEDLDPWDTRFGRGWIALGMAVVLLGFFLPFATATVEDVQVTWSGFDLANARARTLWTAPFVVALFGYLLIRRRTMLAMMGARLVAIVLSFVPAGAVLSAMVPIWRGVDRMQGGGLLEWGIGIPVMAVGCGLLFFGALRLGRMPADQLPYGGAPEASEGTPSIAVGDGEAED